MNARAGTEEEDRAREEWFARVGERRREWEREEGWREEQRRRKKEWWGEYVEGRTGKGES